MNKTANRIVKKVFYALLPLVGAGLLSTGCQTYKDQNKVIGYWHQGDLTNAYISALKRADGNANNKDAIVWRLEEATVLRAAGRYEDSNQAFDQAQEKIDDYAQKAKVRVGQEAGALLSNLANLDYEGRSYDGIMLNTYKALNYLALGLPDNARPELIRAYQRQQDAVDDNKKRIEKTQEEAAKSKDKAKMDQAAENPQFQSQLQNSMAGINDVKVYADYVNPFTVYLDGLFFMANAVDASDLERAHKSFERVASFAGDNDYVKQDLATVAGLLNGKPLTPTTYVIFETGCAPIREQIRIDIPIIVSKVSYVGAAFPTLKPQGNFHTSLTIFANGTNYNTETLASLDSVISLDFKNEMPVVITKTIAATVTKAVAAYAANEAARQAGGDMGGLLMQVTTAVYQMAVNIADERTWTTLPKEFQVARVPTPADHKIHLSAAGQQADAAVEEGAINLVYVKSINPACPLHVTTMKLNGTPLHPVAGLPPATSAPASPEPAPAANPSLAVSLGAAATTATAPSSDPAPVVPAPAPAGNTVADLAPATPVNQEKPAVPAPPAESVPPAPVPPTPAPEKSNAAQTFSNPAVQRQCESLNSPDLRVVIKSLKLLRQLNSPEAVPQVLLCLQHPNYKVVREACHTLSVLGDRSTIPALQSLLARRDVKAAAHAAIVHLTRTHRR